MDAEWKLLVQMGLPLGAARGARDFTVGNGVMIRQAVSKLAAAELKPTETDGLAAWLSGFGHHWPTAFHELLGDVGVSSLQSLMPKVEPNRYLKLRRIAIANLANLL